MSIQNISGYEQASEVARGNMSPRYLFLDKLEQYVETTQYNDRKAGWFDADDVPLWERKPCIAYPIVRSAIASNVDLCLGKGRFNGVKSGNEAIDGALAEAFRQCRFYRLSREALAMAQGSRSVAVIFGARNGLVCSNTAKAKWCTPQLNADGECSSLDIRYPFIGTERRPDGSLRAVTKLYRRLIDMERDVTFKPALADISGVEPDWEPQETIEHGLGFCPVVWYPHLKPCQAHIEFDGRAIHEYALDEIEALDMALSQRHRVALYSEPQPYEIGVSKGNNPTATGRTANVPSTPHGGAEGPNNLRTGSYVMDAGVQHARKKGPGHVWQYTNENAKVGYLTVPGDATKSLDDDARDLRIKVAESLSVVFLDPENIKFATTTSGKALATLKQRQLDRCDQIRDDMEDSLLVPSAKMALRIHSIYSGGTVSESQLSELQLAAQWGDYFEPDQMEKESVVRSILAARDGKLITHERAIREAAAIYPEADIEAVVAELTSDTDDDAPDSGRARLPVDDDDESE